MGFENLIWFADMVYSSKKGSPIVYFQFYNLSCDSVGFDGKNAPFKMKVNTGMVGRNKKAMVKLLCGPSKG